MKSIPTFNEIAIREAVLYTHRIEIVSPGGFPHGIAIDNILDRQLPRNRRIADTLAKCGFIERAGQGINRIYESCIQESKALPDFTQTDEWQVGLTLHGQIQDPQFLNFIEKIGNEIQESFDTHDFIIMDLIRNDQPIPEFLKQRLPRLLEVGVLERIGRGRGTRYLLSQRFYAGLGKKKGEYTRLKGLGREENKALLVAHMKHTSPDGCSLDELRHVLPGISRSFLQVLLRELRKEMIIFSQGKYRGTRWCWNSVPTKKA